MAIITKTLTLSALVLVLRARFPRASGARFLGQLPRIESLTKTIYKPEYVDFDQFISQLESVLSVIIKENKNCYMAGDFNLDILKCDRSVPVSNFLNLMYK